MQLARLVLMLTLFLLVVFINVTTVLNNAFYFGATVNDTTIFQSVIWRSGPELILAPAAYTGSFFNTHVSPINYIPDAISYLVKCDSLTYYAWVYALVYGILALVAFDVFYRLYPRWSLSLAFISSIAFICSGDVTSGQWEPHQEIACSLAMILFFIAWSRKKYQMAFCWLLWNALVREDAGALLACPLGMLVISDLVFKQPNDTEGRIKRLKMGLLFCTLSISFSILSFIFQKTFFPNFDLINELYYPTKNPFGHVTPPLVLERWNFFILHREYVWLPCLILVSAGLYLKDAKMFVGGITYIPYWLVCFFAKLKVAGELESYKTFPFVLLMLWPAIFSQRNSPKQKTYALLQILVLTAGLIGWDGEKVSFLEPFGPELLQTRWTPQPEWQSEQSYKRFGAVFRKNKAAFGDYKASNGVISMYPYDFPLWTKSQISVYKPEDLKGVETLIWFEGDRDNGAVYDFLKLHHLTNLYEVANTKMLIASNKDLLRTADFKNVLLKVD